MILSMTGYGKSESQLNNTKLIVEIRSLNSKSLDLSLRTAPAFRTRELDIRNRIAQRLERGKIDAYIYTEKTDNTLSAAATINHDLFVAYYQQLHALQTELNITDDNLTAAILRMPNVVASNENEDIEEPLCEEALMPTLDLAIDRFIAFRQQEGAALEHMFEQKLTGIEQLLSEVAPYEKGRIEHIREHLMQNLNKLSEETLQHIDQNRLEAEMIYYLEKLDITEEKVRLTNHIRYFRETMAQEGNGVGKKLGFVAQEMGREINTLGSKSNQSEMQIIVVKMKDLLEQIKEQVLNVL